MSDGCIFCKIVNGEIPAQVIYQDDLVLAFRDINPVAPVHILIVPRQHIDDLLRLTNADANMLSRVFEAAARLAREHEVAERGFRLVVNTGPDVGQSVPHIHFHLLGGRPMGWPPG